MQIEPSKNEIHAKKSALRQELKRIRGSISEATRSQAAAQLAQHAEWLFRITTRATVAGYFAIGSELNCIPLLKTLAEKGCPLALPRVLGREHPDGLAFHLWSPDDTLKSGQMGLHEPLTKSPPCMPEILLMPLLGFDKQGNRLGYGAGYYDKYIAMRKKLQPQIPPPKLIGIAFSAQALASLPFEAHDQAIDYVLTPQNCIKCA